MAQLDYTLFDADNHYYETRDCFTRCIEPKYRDRAIRVEQENGHDVVYVGDERFTFLERLFFESAVKPGALREMLRNIASGEARGGDAAEPIRPEYI